MIRGLEGRRKRECHIDSDAMISHIQHRRRQPILQRVFWPLTSSSTGLHSAAGASLRIDSWQIDEVWGRDFLARFPESLGSSRRVISAPSSRGRPCRFKTTCSRLTLPLTFAFTLRPEFLHQHAALNRGSKFGNANDFRISTLSSFRPLSVPSNDRPSLPPPFPMKYKTPVQPSQAVTFPPECHALRAVAHPLPSLWPSCDLLASCHFYHRHGPARPHSG
jgi:hypothetical protein